MANRSPESFLPETTNSVGQELGQYVQHLTDLRQTLADYGLEDYPPTGVVTVIPGTEDKGRPIGATLPVYPREECDSSPEGTLKSLFNLESMTGFKPPTKK